MIGTSGTVTTLAAIDRGLSKYDRKTIDGICIEADKLIQVVEMLYGMSEQERSNHPCIGPTRVDLILPGAAIFRCIHDCWPVEKLSIADRGVREGILMQMFDQGSSIGERLVVYQRG